MKRTPDLSRAAFQRALARNGFKQILMWITDTTGVSSTGWGVICHRNGKIARRATLAKVVREREAEIARKEMDADIKADLDRILDSAGM